MEPIRELEEDKNTLARLKKTSGGTGRFKAKSLLRQKRKVVVVGAVAWNQMVVQR